MPTLHGGLPLKTQRTDNPAAARILETHVEDLHRKVGRAFAVLMALQWVACLVITGFTNLRTWEGELSSIHPHLWTSIFVGGAIALPCIVLLLRAPTHVVTRHATCIGQVLFSSLLIHIMDGRIETHFHVFGSLAFIAMYRDWRLLIAPTAVIALDHLVRGYYWPQSVFGSVQTPIWRTMEHAAWVLFEDAVLVYSCVQSARMARQIAVSMAEAEDARNRVEERVQSRTRELAEAKAQMASERNLLAGIVNNIPLCVYWKDTKSTYLGCNPNFAQQMGLETTNAVAGKSDRDFGCPDEEVQTELEMDRSVLGSGEPVINQEVARTVGGRRRQIVMSKVPLVGDRGTVMGLVGLWIDVTEQRELESQVVHSQNLESIGQLAAGIAHEINTPVQYVSDNIRFLKEQFSSITAVLEEYGSQLQAEAPSLSWAERREMLDRRISELDIPFVLAEVPQALDQSFDGLDRVATIVRAMKEFSHPGTAKNELADLNRAIRSTITVCTNRWKYNAEMKLELDPSLPMVPCHVADFNQVILNLVVNAADAIGEKKGNSGDKGVIKVQTRVVDGMVELRIADDGAGIPDSVRHKIFAPFFTTKGVGKGTGQGLAISRNIIVKKLGGSIDFETEVGVGTTFIIRIPLVDSSDASMKKEAA